MKKATIRFWFRYDKQNKNGTCPVYLIYQISGQRKNYLTETRLFPVNWDETTQRAIYINKAKAKTLMPEKHFAFDFPTEREIHAVNAYHFDLKKDVEVIESQFTQMGTPYTVSMVIDKLNEIRQPLRAKEEKAERLSDFFVKFIGDNEATREPGSMQVYRSVAKNVAAYEKHYHKQVTFDKVDYQFFTEFQSFLFVVKDMRNATVNKNLSTVRTFCNYARKYGIKVSEGYKDFSIKNTQGEVIALTQGELDTLLEIDLSGNKRLDQVRDVFCFSCTTGLRYSDLAALRWEHIKDTEIRFTVIKTKQRLTVPLTVIPKQILSKYSKLYRPLPTISNQKMNEYLKELCQLAGIDTPIEKVIFKGNKRTSEVHPKYELIGVHTGRKTFATLSMEKGMSAEETMKITGHRSYSSFKRYVSITEERKQQVMQKAWDNE